MKKRTTIHRKFVMNTASFSFLTFWADLFLLCCCCCCCGVGSVGILCLFPLLLSCSCGDGPGLPVGFSLSFILLFIGWNLVRVKIDKTFCFLFFYSSHNKFLYYKRLLLFISFKFLHSLIIISLCGSFFLLYFFILFALWNV